jgi:hypothetical protein
MPEHSDLATATANLRQAMGCLRRALEALAYLEDAADERPADSSRSAESAHALLRKVWERPGIGKSDLLKGYGFGERRAERWAQALHLVNLGVIRIASEATTGRPRQALYPGEGIDFSAALARVFDAYSDDETSPPSPEPPRIDVPSLADGEASPALN